MMFQLIQEHQITLNTKLATLFPTIKGADKITVADMMYHRSGIHDIVNDTSYRRSLFNGIKRQDVLDIFKGLPLDFEPNTKSAYSNTNYILLGWIIEKLDKNDFATSLKRRISDRLNLKNTYIGGKINEKNKESAPYIYGNNCWVKDKRTIEITSNNYNIIGGAGIVVSTPADLTVFLNGIFNGSLINKASLLQDTTIKGTCGMDIYKIPFEDHFGWGHGGDIFDYHTDLYTFLEDTSLTIAVCYNGINYNPSSVLNGILSICFDVPFDLYALDNRPTINVDSTILKAYVGIYGSKEKKWKFNVFWSGGHLYGKVDGQMQFPLSAVSENEFLFKLSGLDLIFNTENNSLLLKQNSKEILFQKEEAK